MCKRLRPASADPGPVVAGALRRTLAALLTWQRRSAERRRLAAMDERERRDIGLTKIEISREAGKPAWRE